MEITVNELLKGSATTIKNKDYLPTKAYVEPFLEKMSQYTDDFRVQVRQPDQLALIENSVPINVYNRVVVQAVLPDDLVIDNHSQVVGMVYGLDVKRPVVKFYSGALDAVCTNLCIFSPSQLKYSIMEPEKPISFDSVTRIMDTVSESVDFIKRLKNTEFECTYPETSEALGDWIKECMMDSFDSEFGRVKIAATVPIDAYKLLFVEKESRYYVKGNLTDMYNVYGAFTQIFTDSMQKDLMNVCEKTLLLKNILNVF